MPFVRQSTLDHLGQQVIDLKGRNAELRALTHSLSEALRDAVGQVRTLTAQLLALQVPREIDTSEPLPTLYQTDQKLVQQARANERP